MQAPNLGNIYIVLDMLTSSITGSKCIIFFFFKIKTLFSIACTPARKVVSLILSQVFSLPIPQNMQLSLTENPLLSVLCVHVAITD